MLIYQIISSVKSILFICTEIVSFFFFCYSCVLKHVWVCFLMSCPCWHNMENAGAESLQDLGVRMTLEDTGGSYGAYWTFLLYWLITPIKFYTRVFWMPYQYFHYNLWFSFNDFTATCLMFPTMSLFYFLSNGIFLYDLINVWIPPWYF